MYLGDDHLILKGGGHFWSGQIIYFSTRVRPKNLFPGKTEDRIFTFNHNNFFKKQKKKKKINKKK